MPRIDRPKAKARAHSDASAHLREDTRAGGVTLVLGAGVSMARGVPGWRRLVSALWAETFPKRVNLIDAASADPLPQFLPFALELIAEHVGEARFADRLRRALYAHVETPTRRWLTESPVETLAVVARLVAAEHARGSARRIVRVITFNVDDLLEQAVHLLRASRGPDVPLLKVVARASQHPGRGGERAPIPVYHVHGYIPERAAAPWHERSPDTLVFTDLQYWASSASPLSYANRVMAAALHDSHCVFLGTSMTDINVLRWLALRTNEIRVDKAAQFAMRPVTSASATRKATRAALGRHYWCRTASCDPTSVISRAMDLRGIRAVEFAPKWGGPELATLLDDCFPR